MTLVSVLVATQAFAGACCSGTTSVLPTRVGPCEHWATGVELAGHHALGRWTSLGKQAGFSGTDDSADATLLGATRVGRWGSFGVSIPFVVASKTESTSPLLADVTGQSDGAVVLSAGLERTSGLWPYALAADVELPISQDETGVPFSAGASFGRALGSAWTAALAGRYTTTVGKGTAATTVGARVVYGLPVSFRTWLGVDVPIAVDGVGLSATREHRWV